MNLKTKRRRTFNGAPAEPCELDLRQSGPLGVVTVSNERQHANEILSKDAGFFEHFDGAVMQDYHTRFV